jgi:hypothetical protein
MLPQSQTEQEIKPYVKRRRKLDIPYSQENEIQLVAHDTVLAEPCLDGLNVNDSRVESQISDSALQAVRNKIKGLK